MRANTIPSRSDLISCRASDEGLSTADKILQNLSKRPHVQSTLILSRKDGSIIKATGLITSSTEDSQQGAAYADAQTSSPTAEKDQIAPTEKQEATSTEPATSPAHVIAESIYTFVASAGALAESLGKINAATDSSRTRNEAGRVDVQHGDGTAARSALPVVDEVQLLRLRLKKQEVIIFPDPQYLCCVVQDLEKTTR